MAKIILFSFMESKLLSLSLITMILKCAIFYSVVPSRISTAQVDGLQLNDSLN